MARLSKNYPNVDRFTDRHGKTRYYYRQGKGPRLKIEGEFGSHEFDASYEEVRKRAGGIQPGEKRTRAGTVDDLCVRYYNSFDFKNLRATTQKNYRRQIEMFRDVLGGQMVRSITRRHFNDIKAQMADRPGACRTFLKRLKTLFTFAVVELEMIDVNPLDHVKLPAEGKGFTPWTEDDIALYEARWPSGSRERMGLAVLLYGAQRRSDTVKMGRQHIRNGMIQVTQGKTDARAWVPVHSEFQKEIDLLPPDQMLFVVNPKTGAQLSSEGFGNWIRKNAKAASIPGTRGPHGLRKAACRRLIEAGCDTEMAIAISGHSSADELEPYIRDVNRKLKAEQAGKLWDK